VSNVITSTIGQEKFGKLSGFHFTTSRQNMQRGERERLLGIDTCPSLNDIMEIRCIKCNRSEQVYDYPKHRLVRIDAGVTNPILFSNKGLKVKKCCCFCRCNRFGISFIVSDIKRVKVSQTGPILNMLNILVLSPICMCFFIEFLRKNS
jgi:hypothetical protein